MSKRLLRKDRDILQRMADGWVPMLPQLTGGMRLEKRGFIRAGWGPEGTPQEDMMCWHLTDAGRKALEAGDAASE